MHLARGSMGGNEYMFRVEFKPDLVIRGGCSRKDQAGQ